MRRAKTLLLAAAAFAGAAAHAEPSRPQALSPDSIRTAYRHASMAWRPLPSQLREAFILAEDKHFWRRSPSRSTVTRSVAQIAASGAAGIGATVAVAQALDHGQIADWFVNGVFLGQNCFGVSGAAVAYFGRNAGNLTLAETALLASAPRAPADLVHRPGPARERRNRLIDDMAAAGRVTAAEAESAKAEALGIRQQPRTCSSP